MLQAFRCQEERLFKGVDSCGPTAVSVYCFSNDIRTLHGTETVFLLRGWEGPFTQANHVMAIKKDSTQRKQGKKGWFKTLLERIAKANKESGGQICSA
jgi:hypothetical protein